MTSWDVEIQPFVFNEIMGSFLHLRSFGSHFLCLSLPRLFSTRPHVLRPSPSVARQESPFLPPSLSGQIASHRRED